MKRRGRCPWRKASSAPSAAAATFVLEWFTTCRALMVEGTRRQPSEALLHQSCDTAGGVLGAWLAQARHCAEQEVERWRASVGADGGGTGAVFGAAVALTIATVALASITVLEAMFRGNDGEDAVEPESKRRRLDPMPEPLKDDLPADDWQILLESRESSSSGRKARRRAAAARAPTPPNLSQISPSWNDWHGTDRPTGGSYAWPGRPAMAAARG